MNSEPQQPEPKTAPRSGTLVVVVLLLLGGCLGLTGAFYALRYELRRGLMASFDTRLVLTVEGEDFDPKGVAEHLRERFRRHGILAQVDSEGDQIVVLISSLDRAYADPIVAGGVEFRVLIEVPEGKLSPEAYAGEISRVQAAQAAGKWSPSEDSYATYPWHPQAFGAKGPQLLLSTQGMLDESHFAEFSQVLDSEGRHALGFKTTRAGAKRLRALSGDNLGSRLAIVVDGQIRSAPIVRGAISRQGVVEGGAQGWTQGEVIGLVLQLEAGQVPFSLRIVEESKIAPGAKSR